MSIYFSVRAVSQEVFSFKTLNNGTYELVKFSNTGNITDLTVGYVSAASYDANDPSGKTIITQDKTKPVTVLHEYAFNCDEKLEIIHIGKEVAEIDGKSFYSCWALREIRVDPENKYYCDIDGVLYTKDLKTLVCYPISHDQYVRANYGYDDWVASDDPAYQDFRDRVLTYVVPSATEKIEMLAFNYASLTDIYLPEGLREIGTLAFFKATILENIRSYTAAQPITDTTFVGEDVFATLYPSLPEGVESIGSDAFNHDQALTYMYIPSSVTYIGHHAFWECVYKDGGDLRGLAQMHIAASEPDFHANTHTGDQWRPQYDYMLFKKTIDTNYSAVRAAD